MIQFAKEFIRVRPIAAELEGLGKAILKPNIYVEVECNGKQFRTELDKHVSENPHWKESLFVVDGLNNDAIELRVMERDKLRRTKTLGKAHVTIQEASQQFKIEGIWIDLTSELKTIGKLLVEFQPHVEMSPAPTIPNRESAHDTLPDTTSELKSEPKPTANRTSLFGKVKAKVSKLTHQNKSDQYDSEDEDTPVEEAAVKRGDSQPSSTQGPIYSNQQLSGCADKAPVEFFKDECLGRASEAEARANSNVLKPEFVITEERRHSSKGLSTHPINSEVVTVAGYRRY